MRTKSPSLFTLMLFALCAALIGATGAWLIAVNRIVSYPPLMMATDMPTAIPTVQPALAFISASLAPTCTLINSSGSYAFVRTAPRDDFSFAGLLPVDGMIQAVGHTSNGWYVVNYAERLAWISASVVTPSAQDTIDCAAMPLFRNPLIPDAPENAPEAWLSVDRDGDGSLNGAISTPGGNLTDVVWINVINLYNQPPNNYREMVVTLECTGDGSEWVRWGSVTQPALRCGAAITMPFLDSAARQPVLIAFADGAPQSYIEYDLRVLQAVG